MRTNMATTWSPAADDLGRRFRDTRWRPPSGPLAGCTSPASACSTSIRAEPDTISCWPGLWRRGTGTEVEPALVARARRLVEREGLSDRIRFELVSAGPAALRAVSCSLLGGAFTQIADKSGMFGCFRVLRLAACCWSMMDEVPVRSPDMLYFFKMEEQPTQWTPSVPLGSWPTQGSKTSRWRTRARIPPTRAPNTS
jgi:hypothetical protein